MIKFILKYQLNTESSRIITTIGGYPMYQSAGVNSAHKDTFFPFCGVLENEFSGQSRGWFLKPGGFKNPPLWRYGLGLSKYFPGALIDYLRDHFSTTFFMRFGNLEAMLLSYLIGGGFWIESSGVALARFLENHYKAYINEVKKKNKSEINSLKEILAENVSMETINGNTLLAERAINLTLISRCEKMKGCQMKATRPFPVPKNANVPPDVYDMANELARILQQNPDTSQAHQCWLMLDHGGVLDDQIAGEPTINDLVFSVTQDEDYGPVFRGIKNGVNVIKMLNLLVMEHGYLIAFHSGNVQENQDELVDLMKKACEAKGLACPTIAAAAVYDRVLYPQISSDEPIVERSSDGIKMVCWGDGNQRRGKAQLRRALESEDALNILPTERSRHIVFDDGITNIEEAKKEGYNAFKIDEVMSLEKALGQVLIAARGVQLKPVKTYYPYADTQRWHLFKVVFETADQTFEGDAAKAEILSGFKVCLDSCRNLGELNDMIEILKMSRDYSKLATSTGLVTKIMGRKTDSIVAFDLMCEDARNQVNGSGLLHLL